MQAYFNAESLPQPQLVGCLAHEFLWLGQKASRQCMVRGCAVTHLSIESCASDALKTERV